VKSFLLKENIGAFDGVQTHVGCEFRRAYRLHDATPQ